MNIMQKATKHGLSGLLLAVTVFGVGSTVSSDRYADIR